MRPIPIFDTNVFADVQRGVISQVDWRAMLRHRPAHGWPLSSVTALELLAGIHGISANKFPQLKEQISLAFSVSRGRVLEDPRYLICLEILHLTPPNEFVQFAGILTKYLDVTRRATSLADLLGTRVRYRQGLTRGKGRAGFDPAVVEELVAHPKRIWRQQVEATATDLYPEWREHFAKTGKRLPQQMRKPLEPLDAWHPEREKLAKAFLEWMGASIEPALIAKISRNLDAVMEFTVFVAREFLINNYSPEKHESDIYDQVQLHHLAAERFLIVSADADLRRRISRSFQAARILSFSQFLSTL